jgi:hypothetical protein
MAKVDNDADVVDIEIKLGGPDESVKTEIVDLLGKVRPSWKDIHIEGVSGFWHGMILLSLSYSNTVIFHIYILLNV